MDEEIEFAILNIDKPAGPTSFQVAERVGKIVGARKFSHFGTLDPKVTGVLPVALNRACKLTGYFIQHDKTYVGIARFHAPIGVPSKEGKEIDLKIIEEMIKKKFLGVIKQTPPVKSRVKRQEREREIYSFDLLEQKGKDVLFKVKCQGGTYIRKLIDDLGIELGVGAHMLELRRTSAGIFGEEDKEFVNLYELEKAVEDGKLNEILITGERAIKKVLPVVQIKNHPGRLKQILTGKQINKEDIEEKTGDGETFVVFCGKRFIGIYKEEGRSLKPMFVKN
jgi:H/ACA ribonucleoprotein complex subunit 4